MELDIRMTGSTELRCLEWFPSLVEANCVRQTGARYRLTILETSYRYPILSRSKTLRVCDGMADMRLSKSRGEIRGGSTPSIPTNLLFVEKSVDFRRRCGKVKE